MAASTVARTVVAGTKQRRKGFNPGYVFVLPYILLLLFFGIVPSVYALFISFTDPNSDTTSFNGLANYITAFHDFRFLAAFAHALLYLLLWLPITTVGVLFLALLLHARASRFSTVMRLIYFLPGAVTGSASVLLWMFMFDPSVSPFNFIFSALGVRDITAVIYEPNLPILLTIIAFSTGAGGWIVVMYGAFQNISNEILEAAKIDGCNAIQTALSIKLPLISKYIVYMLILSFAGGIQLFVEPQLLSKAVRNTISPTWSPNELAYEFAFNLGNFGVSAAISTLLLIVGLIGAFLLIFRTRFFSTEVR